MNIINILVIIASVIIGRYISNLIFSEKFKKKRSYIVTIELIDKQSEDKTTHTFIDDFKNDEEAYNFKSDIYYSDNQYDCVVSIKEISIDDIKLPRLNQFGIKE